MVSPAQKELRVPGSKLAWAPKRSKASLPLAVSFFSMYNETNTNLHIYFKEGDVMIFGKIQNLAQDRLYLPKAIQKGLDYINNANFSKIETGRYEIQGSDIYALVQDYQTAPKQEKRPEAHRRYIDIQYIVEGTEVMGYGLENAVNPVAEDRLAEKDVINLSSVKDEMDLILTPGMYAVLFPSDVHRPGCQYGAGGPVKKVVVKVAMSLL
jgi:biofilm protein TabA